MRCRFHPRRMAMVLCADCATGLCWECYLEPEDGRRSAWVCVDCILARLDVDLLRATSRSYACFFATGLFGLSLIALFTVTPTASAWVRLAIGAGLLGGVIASVCLRRRIGRLAGTVTGYRLLRADVVGARVTLVS